MRGIQQRNDESADQTYFRGAAAFAFLATKLFGPIPSCTLLICYALMNYEAYSGNPAPEVKRRLWNGMFTASGLFVGTVAASYIPLSSLVSRKLIS